MTQDNNCIFCKIIKREIKAEIIEESNSFIAVKDAKPVTNGHTLIIPKKHLVTLLDIPDKMGEELLNFKKKVAGKLIDTKKGDGFNIIMNNLQCAGQAVMHAHLHIIPRKDGDGIKFLKRV